jgi:polyhydroxybutyrate depolymerase
MKHLALSFFMLIGLAASAQEKKENIIVDGLKREFVTYLPAGSDSGDAMPVIISLHGRLGTAEGEMKFSDFRPIADREKMIVVCPQGINRSWNDGRGTPAHKKGINDVKFIDELISYVLKTYHADPKRVYLTGMSNGGFMTSRLACELPDRIAAIAVVAASMDQDENYAPKKRMPAMYIQGTADPLVPFAGGPMKRGAGGAIYGHEDVLKAWATADRCDAKAAIINLPVMVNDGTSITKAIYEGPNGIKVIGYTVNNGGHTWPGGTQYLPKAIIGSLSHNMNACEVIWNFFRQYHK